MRTFAKITFFYLTNKEMQKEYNFAVFCNDYRRDEIKPYIERIRRYAAENNCTVSEEPSSADGADFAVSLGGDGTFLRTALKVGSRGVPIIGVNMGRLGFLSDVMPGEIEKALDDVRHGQYIVEHHTVIQVVADGKVLSVSPYALNDVAVSKRDSASMISIRTFVNGEFLVNYQADGLIVSTPTGSTAYSLSNGGPIIVPQSGSLCITPVAPHSLNIRPIVVSDTSEIRMEVESRNHSFLVAVDGRSEKVSEGTVLTITRAPYTIGIVRRGPQRYFSTLREKLLWGADTRQR